MGYSYGTKWTNEMVEMAIKDVMQKAKIKSMPTHSVIKRVTGSDALSNAIRRRGGTRYWANKLGLELKKCESEMGRNYECECMSILTTLGFDSELTKARYPYDILANNNIKIDVKSSNLYVGENGSFYSFHLEKEKPTCDVFVCYCIDNKTTTKIYILPSCVVSGKTMLSIGKNRSKYDRYIDNWAVIKQFDEFYNLLKCE